jgi:hypothetical protein
MDRHVKEKAMMTPIAHAEKLDASSIQSFRGLRSTTLCVALCVHYSYVQ